MLATREVDMRVRWIVVLIVTALSLLLVPAVASAASETVHETHSFDASAARRVLVDVSFHDVLVTVRPGDRVDVVVHFELEGSSSRVKELAEDYRPEFLTEGDRLIVRSTRDDRGSWSWFGSLRTEGRVEVAMPPGLDLVCDTSSGSCRVTGDLGEADLTCDTSSGGCELEGAARTVRADTSSGEVRLRLTREVKEVVADTSSGEVVVTGPVLAFSADTSSGGVEAEGLLGDAHFDTSSGEVVATWSSVAEGARAIADTSSGEVELTFPDGTALDGSVSTGSGDIRSDWPGEMSRGEDELRLEGGAGAVRLRVDTSSGDVTLRRR